MIDIEYINKLIETENVTELASYMKANDLILTDDNKIVHSSGSFKEEYAFWDKRQLVKKILLNS